MDTTKRSKKREMIILHLISIMVKEPLNPTAMIMMAENTYKFCIIYEFLSSVFHIRSEHVKVRAVMFGEQNSTIKEPLSV